MSEVDILRKELAELKKMMMTGNRQYCSSVSDDDKKPVELCSATSSPAEATGIQ